MPAPNVAAMVIGLAVAGLGCVGLAAPSLLIGFGSSLITETGLYVVAGVRIAIGLMLLLAARPSRMPRALRAIGVVIIIAGFVTPMIGVDRSAYLFSWFSAQGPTLVRVVATLAIVLGALIVYAAVPGEAPPSNQEMERP